MYSIPSFAIETFQRTLVGTYQNQWPPQKEHLLQKKSFISKLKKITGYVGVSIPQKNMPKKVSTLLSGVGFLGFSFSGFSCADASHICQVLEGHRGTEVRDPEHPSLVEYTPEKLTFWTLENIYTRVSQEKDRPKLSSFWLSILVFRCCITVAKLKVSLGIPSWKI